MPIHNVQSLLVEVDSRSLLEQYLRIAIKTALHSNQEIAVRVLNTDGSDQSSLPASINQETDFPIIMISGWYERKEGERLSISYGSGDVKIFSLKIEEDPVESAIRYISEQLDKNGRNWGKQFKEKFGDGYNEGFNEFDGIIRLGYKIRTTSSFPQWLAISIVHIYYGK